MIDVEFTNEITVKLIRHSAADDYVIQAAQVSSKGENNPETVPERLIKALMAGRHGSPFEHTSFTFFIKVPLYVAREWQRHRISSFNEWSGRYSEMLPEFYIPGPDRKMINIGTKMKPEMVRAKPSAYEEYKTNLENANEIGWRMYKSALRAGISNEVARMGLPLNTMTQMYWTVNARSLMNFLSLRVESYDSLVRSYPQLEIHLAAQKVEEFFERLMPVTHEAFVANGRVAP
jgi:thymidylate synthase (FAD)